ncbi:MAG TPA: class I SAM-dependent methyltransferase [Caulobacteraceae bacterium]|nr:class I SAM-dependent methyltransferase [Caulobacteraceae bacterium]
MADPPPDPSSAEIVGLYERHADAWDAARGRTRFAERGWIDRFAALLPAGGAVLDLGCGSGEPIGRHLANAGFAVTGVDGSAPLIELCRARMPAQTWLVGDMREVALGRRFDGLIAWHSFFHLTHDDQRRMFDVFAAHAAPTAALMFTSGPAHGEALGRFEGETLYHASLAQEEYRALLAARGFEVVAFVAEDPQSNGDTVWLARRAG